jgi:hypothetical protein
LPSEWPRSRAGRCHTRWRYTKERITTRMYILC